MSFAIPQRVDSPSERSTAPAPGAAPLGRVLQFAAPGGALDDEAALLDRYLFDREWRREVTSAARAGLSDRR